MLRVMDASDQRDQVELDVDLPVLWRLSCGALSGAVAQSGQYDNIAHSTPLLCVDSIYLN